ncbi:MAG TPA: hypothetical protein VK324_10585 [Tepidisphaeraceae bacterium]|nr:hypothetical protein [Tepidisphaeraceae bacterium]
MLLKFVTRRQHVEGTSVGTTGAACRPLVEVTRRKEVVFAQRGFDRLGYADASILAAADGGDTTVLTDDAALYHQHYCDCGCTRLPTMQSGSDRRTRYAASIFAKTSCNSARSAYPLPAAMTT